MPDNKKFQNIQALRGVAVLAVVLFHLASVELKYGGGGDCCRTGWILGSLVSIYSLLSADS